MRLFIALVVPIFLAHNSHTADFIVPEHEKLSPLEHYVRCYSKLSLQAPSLTSSNYIAVKEGRLDPVTACMNLLSLAKMTGTSESNLKLPDAVRNGANGEVAQEIIRNFHNFHKSWFPNKMRDSSAVDTVTSLVMDYEEPALYVTRALFGQAPNKPVPLKSIVTYNKSLKALRSRDIQSNSNWVSRSFFNYPTVIDGEPSGITYEFLNLPMGTNNNPSSPHHTIAMSVSDNQLTEFGDLYGVTDAPPLAVTKVRRALGGGRGTASDIDNNEILSYMLTSQFQNRNLRQHHGGGILGSQYFIMANNNLPDFRAAYGERLVGRRYTTRVQEILMCHTFPNLKPTDVQSEVIMNSEYSFRKATSCMQCHSAIDPLAGTIRNLITIQTANQGISLNQLKLGIPSRTVASLPTDNTKKDYAFKTPTGRLFYRNFKGQLISQNVNGLGDLGNKISTSLDFYACTAKRYYYFLTGIDVTLTAVEGESELTKYHRAEVFKYADQLQNHQSLTGLIQSILKSNTFTSRNYMSKAQGEE